METLKKRVLVTLPRGPYERMQKNAIAAGLGRSWFSHELGNFVVNLDRLVLEVLELQKKGTTLTNAQVLQKTIDAAGKIPGLKIEIETPNPQETQEPETE